MLSRQPAVAPPETVITETVPQVLADLKKGVSELLALLESMSML
jgi:hypothetical protein